MRQEFVEFEDRLSFQSKCLYEETCMCHKRWPSIQAQIERWDATGIYPDPEDVDRICQQACASLNLIMRHASNKKLRWWAEYTLNQSKYCRQWMEEISASSQKFLADCRRGMYRD
jgi:hypothetical protein